MRPARRILVIGGESSIGAALAAAHALRGDNVNVTTRRRLPAARGLFLDLARVPEGWMPPAGTEIAYVCASLTSLQRCEDEPETTASVNVRGTLQVCRALARAGVFVVFYSTNLVFDGETPGATVATARQPRCEYGRQKTAVEKALHDEKIPAAVIRLSKVIDRSNALLNTWTSALRRGEPITAFSDMVMAPIALEPVVDASIATAEHKFHGLVHLSAACDVTYFDAARHLAKYLGVPADLVRPAAARATLASGRFIPRHTTLAPSLDAPISFTPPDHLLAIENYAVDAAARTLAA